MIAKKSKNYITNSSILILFYLYALSYHKKNLMKVLYEEETLLKDSRPLQNIKTVENSLLVLRHKLTQMNKRESQNTQQIQKLFYSSIPNLKNKLYQTIQSQKVQEKKKILFNQSVLMEKNRINRERKLINEKEIERNKELVNISKINGHNSVKEMSKKNQILIQRMKNFRIEQNRKRKQLVKGSLENSRLKIQDFRTIKLDEIRKQKQEETNLLQLRISKMQAELSTLGNKENETYEKVEKSEEALKQLRWAVDKMQKMNENQFITLKNKIQSQTPDIIEERLIEKMLLAIIETSKASPKFHSRKVYPSKWASEHSASQKG